MSEQNEFMQEEELIEIIENQLEDGEPVKVNAVVAVPSRVTLTSACSKYSNVKE